MIDLNVLKRVINGIEPIKENYSQFTIDFIEELERQKVSSKYDVVATIHYDVQNVLDIIKPDLPDTKFFNVVEYLTNLK